MTHDDPEAETEFLRLTATSPLSPCWQRPPPSVPLDWQRPPPLSPRLPGSVMVLPTSTAALVLCRSSLEGFRHNQQCVLHIS